MVPAAGMADRRKAATIEADNPTDVVVAMAMAVAAVTPAAETADPKGPLNSQKAKNQAHLRHPTETKKTKC